MNNKITTFADLDDNVDPNIIIQQYPYFVCFHFERTSTLDHNYDPPIFAKTFEDGYNYLLQYFYDNIPDMIRLAHDDSIVLDNIELDKIYVQNYDRSNEISFRNISAKLQNEQVPDEEIHTYYLNSLENSKINGQVFQTPNYGLIVKGFIIDNDSTGGIVEIKKHFAHEINWSRKNKLDK